MNLKVIDYFTIKERFDVDFDIDQESKNRFKKLSKRNIN